MANGTFVIQVFLPAKRQNNGITDTNYKVVRDRQDFHSMDSAHS